MPDLSYLIHNGTIIGDHLDDAMYSKIGTAALDTGDDNLSDAVNTLSSSLVNSNIITNTVSGVTLSYVIRGNVLYGVLKGTPSTTSNISFANMPSPVIDTYYRQQQWGTPATTLNYYIENNSTTLTLRGHVTSGALAQSFSYAIK